jgi:hypothetical protein
MKTIADDFKTVLDADTTLMNLLTGRVWTGVKEIQRNATAAAFDANKELLPCALIKMGPEIPRGPYRTSTQVVVYVYFYQRAGNSIIESAMDRAYTLLHDKKIGSGTFRIEHDQTIHTYELIEREDNALDAQMGVQRYVQVKLR